MAVVRIESACSHRLDDGHVCETEVDAFMGTTFYPSCDEHETVLERKVMKWIREAIEVGYSQRVEDEAQIVEALPAVKGDPKLRLTDPVNGDQFVIVDHLRAYRWSGKENLQVGDWVLCPPTGGSSTKWAGRVTSLGSSYKGMMRTIISADRGGIGGYGQGRIIT